MPDTAAHVDASDELDAELLAALGDLPPRMRAVVVQVWETIDLTDEQIVELAEGITVTDDVEAGVG